MQNFIVYDKRTGEILRTGTCPKSMAEIQASNDSEMVIEGMADDVCDQIDIKTKKVMKDHRTSRKAIKEAEEFKRIKETPIREKEALIKNKMRQMAIDELIKEGKIKKEDLA